MHIDLFSVAFHLSVYLQVFAKPFPIDGTTKPLTLSSDSEVCIKLDKCSCSLSDGSGIINLHSLGSSENSNIPKWSIQGNDGWIYKYNPCWEFSLGRYDGLAVLFTIGLFTSHPIVAVINSSVHSTTPKKALVVQTGGGSSYDIGVQSTVSFNQTSDGKPFVHYIAGDNDRRSRIILKCNPNTEKHTLNFIGEIQYNPSLYEFVLEGPCSCPGYCDDNGLRPGVNIQSSTNKSVDDLSHFYEAINQVELELHRMQSRFSNIQLHQYDQEDSLIHIEKLVSSVKKKFEEFEKLQKELDKNKEQFTKNHLIEVENQLQKLEGKMLILINQNGKKEEDIFKQSYSSLVALLIHDGFIVIVILLALIVARKNIRRLVQQSNFKQNCDRSDVIYKPCKCEGRLIIHEA